MYLMLELGLLLIKSFFYFLIDVNKVGLGREVSFVGTGFRELNIVSLAGLLTGWWVRLGAGAVDLDFSGDHAFQLWAEIIAKIL